MLMKTFLCHALARNTEIKNSVSSFFFFSFLLFFFSIFLINIAFELDIETVAKKGSPLSSTISLKGFSIFGDTWPEIEVAFVFNVT